MTCYVTQLVTVDSCCWEVEILGCKMLGSAFRRHEPICLLVVERVAHPVRVTDYNPNFR